MPLVVIAPLSEVVPPPPAARFLMPVKVPLSAVVPPKFSVRSWVLPAIPPVRVPLVPIRVRSPTNAVLPVSGAIDTAPPALWVVAPEALPRVTEAPPTEYPPSAVTAPATVAAPAAATVIEPPSLAEVCVFSAPLLTIASPWVVEVVPLTKVTDPVSRVARTIAPFVPVAVSRAPASMLSSQLTTVVSLAPTSATDWPVSAGVAVPPLSLTSISVPATVEPLVIVTLSGLPIPTEKVASVAATSARLPLAVALPVTPICGAASSNVPTSPLPAVVVSVPPMVIVPLPPVKVNALLAVLARNAVGSVAIVVSTSPPVLKLPVGPTRIPFGLLSQTTMFDWPVTAPAIVEVLLGLIIVTRLSTAYWVPVVVVR